MPQRIKTITRPRIFGRIGHHAGTHRIELNIAHAGQQIRFAVDQRCFVPAFPKRAGAPVTVIEILHIITPQHLQRFAQTGFEKGRHQQMDMIGHQYIGMYLTIMLFTGCQELFQIKAVIRIAAENLGTVVTANDDMLRLAGNDHSRKTSHELKPERKQEATSLAGFYE